MTYRMVPRTAAGKRFVDLIEAESSTILEQADLADRNETVPQASFDRLRAAGVASAFVPEALGGLGLDSVHDWAVGLTALGRMDASVAIGLNMHLGVSRGIADAWRRAETPPPPMTALLEAIAGGNMLICATATEPGTDNLHPLTEAVHQDDGYLINGHKLFVTMSPVATHLAMNMRLRDEGGDYIATMLVPKDTPGIVPQNDWHALGMRGSGSQSVRFENCLVPHQAVRKLGPWGRWSLPVITNRTAGNLPLVAVFLGIAEAAYDITIAELAGGNVRNKSRSGVVHMVAEMEIDLATCQALMARATELLDDFLKTSEPTLEAAYEILKDYQNAKWVINHKTTEIVSQAMDLVGGRSFTSQHRLSRLYRDVRAGSFMQPYSRPEAREYIGRVALKDYPEF